MTTKPVRIMCVTQGREIPDRLDAILDSASAEREARLDRVLDRFENDSFDLLFISHAAIADDVDEGMELLEVVTAQSPMTQIVFLTDADNIDSALSALQAGSFQYLKEPIEDDELRLVVEAAMERRPSYAPNLLLRREQGRSRLQKLIGKAPAMQEVYRQIQQAATTDIPVLITGETGTGKDLAAHAIHRSSPRRKGPYLPVNLGAVPPELVGSELFGHEKGSFTGAAERREGIFERAREGTVFLDEIGTIDEKVQISLLRLLDQKRFHRLGGRRWLNTDARVIAASNDDLWAAVERGEFREDLYYRLDVFHITMPPLRERSGDLHLLADAFLRRYATAYGKDLQRIAEPCQRVFREYGWPGNVRELKNVIQRAVLVATGRTLLPEHLPPRLAPEEADTGTVVLRIGTPLRDAEQALVKATLDFTGNNRSATAELLGISRRALYNKLERFGLR